MSVTMVQLVLVLGQADSHEIISNIPLLPKRC